MTPPRQTKIIEESNVIEFDGKVDEHIRDCTKNGRQMSNLTTEEEKGMKSLLQISKANELSVCLTDESGMMCLHVSMDLSEVLL